MSGAHQHQWAGNEYWQVTTGQRSSNARNDQQGEGEREREGEEEEEHQQQHDQEQQRHQHDAHELEIEYSKQQANNLINTQDSPIPMAPGAEGNNAQSGQGMNANLIGKPINNLTAAGPTAAAAAAAADSSSATTTITNQPNSICFGPGASRVAPESQSNLIHLNIHPLLYILDQHSALVVKQRVRREASCCGFEYKNSYTIRASNGQPVLKAIDESACCERFRYSQLRSLTLNIMHGEELVARVKKDFRSWKCFCRHPRAEIESPVDTNPIGYMSRTSNWFSSDNYAIYEPKQNEQQNCTEQKDQQQQQQQQQQDQNQNQEEHEEEQEAEFANNGPKNTINADVKPSFVFDFSKDSCFSSPWNIKRVRVFSGDSQRIHLATIHRRWKVAHEQEAENYLEANRQIDDDHQMEPLTSEGSLRELDHSGYKWPKHTFAIEFHEPNLEARHKLLLLGAAFLINFTHFDGDRRKLDRC